MTEEIRELDTTEIETVSAGDGGEGWPGIGWWDGWKDYWTDLNGKG